MVLYKYNYLTFWHISSVTVHVHVRVNVIYMWTKEINDERRQEGMSRRLMRFWRR